MPGPRVLVMQPLYTEGEKLDYRLLGLQFWLADQLTALGLEGASALVRKPGDSDDPPELVTTHPPTDAEIRQALVAHAARWGVLASFAVLSGIPHLAVVRLFEVRRGHPLRTLQRWAFDDASDHLAAAAHTVLVDVAKRLGFVLAPSRWDQLFGTSDVAAASNYLLALGCFSVCDLGFVVGQPELVLRALLTGIHAGMEPAKQLLPHLVEALGTSGSAEVATVRAAVEAAVDIVHDVPEHWRPMLRRLHLGEGPGLVN